MKKVYLKPIAEYSLMSSEDIMITASAGGTQILGNGGSTSEGNIIEGDSRRVSVWGDDEEEW